MTTDLQVAVRAPGVTRHDLYFVCTYLHHPSVLYLTTVQLFPAKIVLSPRFDRCANNSVSVLYPACNYIPPKSVVVFSMMEASM